MGRCVCEAQRAAEQGNRVNAEIHEVLAWKGHGFLRGASQPQESRASQAAKNSGIQGEISEKRPSAAKAAFFAWLYSGA